MFQISVIIATYNRSESLKKSLESLSVQETNEGLCCDVIVVDNNSTDSTKAVVESYQDKFEGRLQYLFEPVQGKSYALNKGVQATQGDVVAFTDDDVIVDANWLMSIKNCFTKYDCDCMGGRVIPIYPDRTPQWVKMHPTKCAGVVVIADYGKETRPYDGSMDPFIGSNYAFKRNVFNDCGYFREDLGPGTSTIGGEDYEFITRLKLKGKSLYYCGNALVRHPVDLNRLQLRHIAKWHMALGRYAARIDIEGNDKRFIYYFGVPRYLLKGVIQDGIFLVFSIFSRIQLFMRLKSVFRKVGMIQEYRDSAKQGYLMEKSCHG